MGTVVAAHNTAATLTNRLLHRIVDLELEVEDVSNRSRRNNLRIRGLPETVEEADLEGVAPATLLRRREWKPVTDLLRNNGLHFAWGYPFKILVFNGPKLAVLLPSTDIPTFLTDLDIELPKDFRVPSNCPGTLSLLPDLGNIHRR
ncbi:Hypothetical predicted protein [Pelobates cultripes]|uniref:Uncharacterized protein n=1 Tax=Pelobates cultripes TaxID=61616 RepID=A0AAD1QYJ7_PELCU|nr:Hypothetical predicted protein [Pelobates cultripes]